MRNLDDLYRTAHAAIVEAGRISLGYFQSSPRTWQKGPGQIVTEADLEIDRFLRDALYDPSQDEAWLSEETADDGLRHERSRTWIVDPIDGTRSFSKGKPEFTICIGLVEHGRPLFGFVLNPATDELFAGRAGRGALLNNVSVSTSSRFDLDGAAVVVSQSENQKRKFDQIVPAAKVSTIGSLAYKLVLVACARYDAYLSLRRSNDWDIAAAMCILKESGAVLTNPDGKNVRLNGETTAHSGLIAANPSLSLRLTEHLRTLNFAR